MANLLQKASIVLTPTAYDDGKVLCAKPDEGSGDFDFSRNSAATRVNAQGLVENVQILSGNLLDYSTFTSPSASWSLVGGLWVFDDTANGYLTTPNIAVVVGDVFDVVVDVTIASGNANFRYTSGNAQTSLFDYTDFVDGVNEFQATVAGVDGILQRIFAPASLTDNPFTLNSISIKKISQDTNLPRINYEGFSYQDALGSELIVNGGFDSDTAWGKINATISGGKGNLNGTGVTSMLRQDVLTNGSTYKATFTISNYNSIGNSDIIDASGLPIYVINSNGTFTITFTHTNANGNIYWRARNSSIFSIDNVSVKEYLGQEVVPNSGCGSWLWEPQSTNLITYSNDLSNWLSSGSNTLTSGLTSPSGDNTAYSVATGLGAGNRLIFVTSLSATNTQHTLSAFVKQANGYNIAYLRWGSSELASNIVNFAFDTETLTNVSGNSTDLFVENFGNGWYKIGFTFTTGSSITNQQVQINRGENVSASYWGIQLEQQSYASSLIPTSGSTVTRNQDVCNNGGSLATINSTEGTLYFEGSALFGGSNTQISLSDGTNDNGVKLRFDLSPDRLTVFLRGNAGTFSIKTIVGITQTDNNKIALVWNATNLRIWLNGVEAGTIATNDLPIGLNTLNFANNTGTSNFLGKTKALAVWKEALSDQELADLTYPTPTDPTFTLDFDTIADQFTFARGSEATYVDAQGLIQSTASNDAPRLDYSTGAEAFLLEPQSTNLITYSSDYSQSYWTKQTGITATYNTTETLSPDGTYNATKFVGNGTTGVYKASISVSGVVSRSVYLKSVTGTTTATFKEPNTNVPSPITLTITNEWQRFEMIGDNGSSFQGLQIDDITSDGVYMWGAQLEQQDYATSYIPSNGSQTTRNQETCINATPEINSEEGTLYFEGSTLVNGGTSRIISLSDGTNDNLIYIRFDLTAGRFYGFARGGGGSYTSVFKNGINQTDYNKVALVWNATNFKIWINGSEQDTATINNLPIAMNTLNFTSPTGSDNFYGSTKDIQVYTKALSDAELIKLTT